MEAAEDRLLALRVVVVNAHRANVKRGTSSAIDDTGRNTGRVGPSALIAPVLMARAVPKRVDDANTPVA